MLERELVGNGKKQLYLFGLLLFEFHLKKAHMRLAQILTLLSNGVISYSIFELLHF